MVRKTNRLLHLSVQELHVYVIVEWLLQGIHALLVAETGRRMLRDLRESREVEAAVMKDNPDWIVGESQYYSRRWPHNIMGQISTDDVRTFESDGSKSQEITAELFLV